jgi:membrane fusion protein (multidrug efflux system)
MMKKIDMNKTGKSLNRIIWCFIILVSICALLASGCQKKASLPGQQTPQVTVIKIEPRDTPVTREFVAQTQSSHQVEIRSRVDGFLDKREYVEGSFVKAGQVMFRMDPKPFQAQVEAVEGALAQQTARLKTAQADLARVRPLAKQNALSQKDLDDAVGKEQEAAAAVQKAKADVSQARFNLGYTTITTPVSGLSSYSRVQEGSYINMQNSLLTYVSQLDPMWVTFSLSEEDMLNVKSQVKSGLVRTPKTNEYEVEIVLADGSVFSHKGRITFADAEFNQDTGTFLIRATIPNPDDVLRPGQYVRAHILGAVRPGAILVPQRAVQQGAKGHYVWVVGKDNKIENRPVEVGEWLGNSWFINEGLHAGESVVVDGSQTLTPGQAVVIKGTVANDQPAPPAAPPNPEDKKPEAAKGIDQNGRS